MSALTPHPKHTEPARLDGPQRLWIFPTSAFWKRPDVWRIARLPTSVFLLFWFPALDLLLPASVPWWGHGLLGGLGPYLCVGLLERYLRRHLVPAVDDDGR